MKGLEVEKDTLILDIRSLNMEKTLKSQDWAATATMLWPILSHVVATN